MGRRQRGQLEKEDGQEDNDKHREAVIEDRNNGNIKRQYFATSYLCEIFTLTGDSGS